MLPRIVPKESNEDAQGKLEASEASEHSSEKTKSSEHLPQESGPFSQASSQALTRAHVRASDLIYPISDSDPIGSDQIRSVISGSKHCAREVLPKDSCGKPGTNLRL